MSNNVHETARERGSDLLTPDQAMSQVRAWTDSRVVGERAADRLEVLAAFGIHVALSNLPGEIWVKLAWRTPTRVELTTLWTLTAMPAAAPEPYIAEKLTDLAGSWSFLERPGGASLVCEVEDPPEATAQR
ncbi:hypothetical protein J2S40_000964 [Nocardioides luteus]|uniref:Uncharacterized protein n=1 Tax=Nocardioides luteus TaxID=1844 RepID=A0ABQ5SU69_9ACTN|nr:hypothetical protein [Nocardioides luteus]MDR7309906.1 hypothetical protein [Nocardioides luteus]GGR59658.1 hypothetical protein GCM10010197_28190 [Nocardioides luteus]GLJ67185.1 hypothetical protein GCM10017579_12210 [Nocardioides luteus]